MADKLRFGVIGAGAIGVEHLLSLSSCPRAVAVAVADANARRGREACDRFKISRCYTDYRELLEQPDIEAVTVAVPNHLHAAITIEALRAGKHVLVEKPMATHLKDAQKMAETARKSRRTLMVAQNFRFHPQVQAAKASIGRGEVGDIYHIHSFYSRRAHIPRIGSWFTQKQQSGGGCMLDLGVHFLDLALYLLNEFEVTSVSAATHAKFGPKGRGEFDWGKSEVDPSRPCDVEDFSIALLKLKSGKSVLVQSSWAAFHNPDSREFGVDLLGSEAGMSLFPARLFRSGPLGYETIHLPPAKLPQSEDRIHHFAACALNGKSPLVSLDESLKVQAVLDAVYASAKTKREVLL